MAEEALQAARAAVEVCFSGGAGGFSFSLKIDSPWLAAGIAIGTFYLANKALTERAIKNSLQGDETCFGNADPEVTGISTGSILVQLTCYTVDSLKRFTDDINSEKAKYRLEEELAKVGFSEKIRLTVEKFEVVSDEGCLLMGHTDLISRTAEHEEHGKNLRGEPMIGATKVKVGAQRRVQDDGIRDWDKQLIDDLNRDYPDWETPGQTWMVPPVLNVKATNNKGELAEKLVYDLLQEFGNTRKEPMFVVHSNNFREKVKDWKDRKKDDEKYVKGEHDFVLIHRHRGVIFLQVKAAATTKQQFAAANQQLEKDKMSLQSFAEEHLKGTLKRKVNYELFSCPGYVVMPNCPHPESTYFSNGIFLEDCKDVQTFSSWWDNNILPKKSLDQDLYNCLVKCFVGLFHGVPYPLGSSIEKSNQVLVLNTRQQLKVLLNAAAEQWITGPAGSGKTWILAEKVKQLADKALLHETGEKILVVCYNLPLSKMLKKQFSDHLANHSRDSEDVSSLVEVKTFSKLLFDITERSVESDDHEIKLIDDAVKILERRAPRYDHIFVDECQDLIGDRWPDLFQKLWKDDDDDDDDDAECKHKWFFYDTNQYVGFSDNNVKLKRALKQSSKLTDVLRNTGNIFNQSKKYLKLTIPEIKLGHQECGLAIEWDRSLSSRNVPESEGAKEVVKHIDVLRRNKVLEKDICILVENTEVRDRLSSELKALNVQSQNAETLFEEGHKDRVVVDSLRRFKGLESKVVILYNPPFFVCEDWPVKKVKELLYIAISRCFCFLVIITSSKGCEALKSNEGMKEGTLPSRQQPRVSLVANSNNLITEKKSQTKALFQEPFGRKSMDTQYESGPRESPTKRAYEEEYETEPARHQLSAMEKAQCHQHYKKLKECVEPKKSRPKNVEGSPLLEPGDTSIFKDAFRRNVFGLLSETVKTNLLYVAGHSTTDQSASNVTAVVAQIEYAIYCQRRRDIDTRNYTRDLRRLKQEIASCNTQQNSHKAVVEALHLSSKDA